MNRALKAGRICSRIGKQLTPHFRRLKSRDPKTSKRTEFFSPGVTNGVTNSTGQIGIFVDGLRWFYWCTVMAGGDAKQGLCRTTWGVMLPFVYGFHSPSLFQPFY